MKQKQSVTTLSIRCRTPRGVRGLKRPGDTLWGIAEEVAPREGCVD